VHSVSLPALSAWMRTHLQSVYDGPPERTQRAPAVRCATCLWRSDVLLDPASHFRVNKWQWRRATCCMLQGLQKLACSHNTAVDWLRLSVVQGSVLATHNMRDSVTDTWSSKCSMRAPSAWCTKYTYSTSQRRSARMSGISGTLKLKHELYDAMMHCFRAVQASEVPSSVAASVGTQQGLTQPALHNGSDLGSHIFNQTSLAFGPVATPRYTHPTFH
jgi:hypothetical protein